MRIARAVPKASGPKKSASAAPLLGEAMVYRFRTFSRLPKCPPGAAACLAVTPPMLLPITSTGTVKSGSSLGKVSLDGLDDLPGRGRRR